MHMVPFTPQMDIHGDFEQRIGDCIDALCNQHGCTVTRLNDTTLRIRNAYGISMKIERFGVNNTYYLDIEKIPYNLQHMIHANMFGAGSDVFVTVCDTQSESYNNAAKQRFLSVLSDCFGNIKLPTTIRELYVCMKRMRTHNQYVNSIFPILLQIVDHCKTYTISADELVKQIVQILRLDPLRYVDDDELNMSYFAKRIVSGDPEMEAELAAYDNASSLQEFVDGKPMTESLRVALTDAIRTLW